MNQKKFNDLFTNAIRNNKNYPENLISKIKDGPKLSAKRAFEVYQEDYQARLSEALKNTYQAIHNIIGDEDFYNLSQDYINIYPSSYSDLDDYGNYLFEFLKTHPINNEYIFLSELAHFEWMFKEIFHQPQKLGLSPSELLIEMSVSSNKFQLISTLKTLKYSHLITKLYSLKNDEYDIDYQEEEFILMFKKDVMVKTLNLSKSQWQIVHFLHKHQSVSLDQIIQNAPLTVTPEEFQSLFQILGSNRLLLKSN